MTTTSTAWVPGEPAEFGDVPGVAGAMSGEPRAVRGLFVGDRAPAAQEVEVHALVRLRAAVATRPCAARSPRPAPAGSGAARARRARSRRRSAPGPAARPPRTRG